MDLHLPIAPTTRELAVAVSKITEGLDAVVLSHAPSLVHPGLIHLVLAGNERDLATATRRAAELGGVVD